jgi:stage IV sporulation protein FB
VELDWLLQDYFSITPPESDRPGSAATYAMVNWLVTPSVLWALLNLLPILPMDGGNIMLNSLALSKNANPQRNAHLVSIFFAALVAIYVYQQGGDPMLTMMCVLFAAINWQQLQMMSGRF